MLAFLDAKLPFLAIHPPLIFFYIMGRMMSRMSAMKMASLMCRNRVHMSITLSMRSHTFLHSKQIIRPFMCFTSSAWLCYTSSFSSRLSSTTMLFRIELFHRNFVGDTSFTARFLLRHIFSYYLTVDENLFAHLPNTISSHVSSRIMNSETFPRRILINLC